jgi:hypothetical protein
VSHDCDGARHRDRQRLHIFFAAVAVGNSGQGFLRHVVVECVERVDKSFGDARTHDLGIGFDATSMNVSDILDVAATINILGNLRLH